MGSATRVEIQGDRERDGCWGGSEMRGFCRGNAVVRAAAVAGALVALVAGCTSGGGSTSTAQAAGTDGAAKATAAPTSPPAALARLTITPRNGSDGQSVTTP